MKWGELKKIIEDAIDKSSIDDVEINWIDVSSSSHDIEARIDDGELVVD